MILEQTYKLLKTKYKDQIETLTISDIRIGVLLSAVLLSDGSCGVSSTVIDTLAHCDKKSRDYGDFSPLKIEGQKQFYIPADQYANILPSSDIVIITGLTEE